ncbi:tRNA pseudouridine synthase B [Clostridia bacterium]|nr:tRNA pseudouridine synthase B [Clostridia bacterium]
MNGIILIDKQRDWTSHDVVAKLRGILRERRIGHGGTLDPMATGLLPVFVGRATRAVEYLPGDKTYEAVMTLGLTTTTQDITGETLTTSAERPDPTAVALSFIGERLQTPPMVSAVKINGQKLYDLARQGIEVEREPRKVTFHSIEIAKIDDSNYKLRVKCSAGTYIRTLIHDIGQTLDCGAALASLRRVAVGNYRVEQAKTLDKISYRDLLPLDSLFSEYPAYTVDINRLKCVLNGNPCKAAIDDGLYRVYSLKEEFLALGRAENGILSTVKSFFEVKK